MLNYAFQDPEKSVKTSSKERLKCKGSLFADFCLCAGKIHLHPSLTFGGNSDLSYLLLSSCWKAISERAQARGHQYCSAWLKNPSGAGSEVACYWQGLFSASPFLCKTLHFLHYHRVRSLWAETWETVLKVNVKRSETVMLVKGISPRGCWLPGFWYSRSTWGASASSGF